MSKAKSSYVCSGCAAHYPKWVGQCLECGAWNSLHEERIPVTQSSSIARFDGYAAAASYSKVVKMADVQTGLNSLNYKIKARSD